ncbi:MAG: DNA-3-methyladenine glycosylase I [Desulfamplus sp.]|nr:DNA-3-methyladenine glycosylase I [Desulfamplus sp.]
MDRCQWVGNDELMQYYHDHEWGVPVHSNQLLFEFLTLEGAQAGLSWQTILNKREYYKIAFDNFEPEKVASYSLNKIENLLQNKNIIRNRRKIESVISNAQAVIEIEEQYSSFSNYIWSFTDGKTIQNSWKSHLEIPKHTIESRKMSKELKKMGFKFVGQTICYSFMQAIGMVNDHTTNCFRHKELNYHN